MKVHRLHPVGTLDGLKLRDEEGRRPGPKEVAIRIRATSLIYRDLKVGTGAYAKRANVRGIQVGSREMFEAMNHAVPHAQLKPIVDQQFDFRDARAAYDHLASRAHVGKIVVRVA